MTSSSQRHFVIAESLWQFYKFYSNNILSYECSIKWDKKGKCENSTSNEFNSQWKDKYIFDRMVSLVCGFWMSIATKYNLERHHTSTRSFLTILAVEQLNTCIHLPKIYISFRFHIQVWTITSAMKIFFKNKQRTKLTDNSLVALLTLYHDISSVRLYSLASINYCWVFKCNVMNYEWCTVVFSNSHKFFH